MEHLRFETLGHSVIEKRNEGPNDFGPAWNLPTGFSSGGLSMERLSMELGLAEFGGRDSVVASGRHGLRALQPSC